MASAANQASQTRGSAGSGLKADPLENRPMTFARPPDLAMRLVQEIVAKAEGFLNGNRMNEDAGTSDYPDQRAQGERGNAEPSVAADDLVEPRLAHGVA